MDAIRRGFAIAIVGGLGELARPLAVLWLARGEGAEIAAAAVVAWHAVELAGGAARLGLHRALQRDTTTPERAVASLVIAAGAGIAAGLGVVVWLDGVARVGTTATIVATTAILAIASTMLFFATGTQQTFDRVAGSVATSIGLAAGAIVAHGDPVFGAVAMAAVAIVATSRSIGWRELARAMTSPPRRAPIERTSLPFGPLLRTSLPLGLGELLQLVTKHGDVIAVQLIVGSPQAVVGYAIARGLVDAFAPAREAIDQVITPLVDRANAVRIARRGARWAMAIAAPTGLAIIAASLVAGPTSLIAGLVIILVLGRVAELATSTWSLALAIVAPPSQSVIAPVVGVVAMAMGSVALGGVVGIAASVGLGLVITNIVARRLLEEA